jgi:Domain of unknown function (DUF6456)
MTDANTDAMTDGMSDVIAAAAAGPRPPASPSLAEDLPIPVRRMLLQLLRWTLKGPCRIETHDGAIRLCQSGRQLPLSQHVLAHAQSAGLVVRQGDCLSARPEAAACLRRALQEEKEDRFSDQHREIAEERTMVDGVCQTVRRNLAESPLSLLARLKERSGAAFLPEAAVDAGERLAADFERGHLQPKVTASWEPRIASRTPGERGGLADLTDSAMAARLRVNEALDAMGPELAGVALDVCCFGKGLERVERERSWPARSAKLMLRTALLALARHYAPPPANGRRRHAWGADGFRPEL